MRREEEAEIQPKHPFLSPVSMKLLLIEKHPFLNCPEKHSLAGGPADCNISLVQYNPQNLYYMFTAEVPLEILGTICLP